MEAERTKGTAEYTFHRMQNTSGSKVDEFYDKLSGSYDALYGEEQTRKHDHVEGLLPTGSTQTIVDVGCGTGTLLERLRQKYHFAVGIDLSLQMLRKASRRRPSAKKAHFVRASSTALPIRSKSANCVLAISLLDYGDDHWKEQVSELRRISSSKGTVMFTIFHPQLQTLTLEQIGLPNDCRCESVSPKEMLVIFQGT